MMTNLLCYLWGAITVALGFMVGIYPAEERAGLFILFIISFIPSVLTWGVYMFKVIVERSIDENTKRD